VKSPRSGGQELYARSFSPLPFIAAERFDRESFFGLYRRIAEPLTFVYLFVLIDKANRKLFCVS
jgi:hypothetical protein